MPPTLRPPTRRVNPCRAAQARSEASILILLGRNRNPYLRRITTPLSLILSLSYKSSRTATLPHLKPASFTARFSSTFCHNISQFSNKLRTENSPRHPCASACPRQARARLRRITTSRLSNFVETVQESLPFPKRTTTKPSHRKARTSFTGTTSTATGIVPTTRSGTMSARGSSTDTRSFFDDEKLS